MNKEASFLKRVVLDASKLITDDFEVKAKDDKGDLVTNFDYEVEKFIIDELKKEYPNYDIISEEFNTYGKLSENCFVIDPIDGTINFANKLPEWVIQVAMVSGGKVVAAVVYAPKIKEMYVADKSAAYLNGKKISVNNLPIKKCLYEIDGKSRVTAIERMLPYTRHFRNVGCAGYSFAAVAAGKFGGAIFRNETLWDYVPGMFIAKQAGAFVIDEIGAHIVANTKEFAMLLKQEAVFRENDK